MRKNIILTALQADKVWSARLKELTEQLRRLRSLNGEGVQYRKVWRKRYSVRAHSVSGHYMTIASRKGNTNG